MFLFTLHFTYSGQLFFFYIYSIYSIRPVICHSFVFRLLPISIAQRDRGKGIFYRNFSSAVFEVNYILTRTWSPQVGVGEAEQDVRFIILIEKENNHESMA